MAIPRKSRKTMSQGREDDVMKDPPSDLLQKIFPNPTQKIFKAKGEKT